MHKKGQRTHYFMLLGLLMLTGVIFAAKPVTVHAARTVTVVIDPGHGGKSEENDETH